MTPISRVRIIHNGLWEIHAIGLGPGLLTAKELAHPAVDYLAGFGTEQAARDWAAGQGWQVQ